MGRKSRAKKSRATERAHDDEGGSRPSRPRRAEQAVARESALAWRPPSAALESFAGKRWVIPTVLGLGLVLRLAHLHALKDSPFASALLLDARYYDSWAQQIASGAFIGDAPFWVDPLYAYVLGGLYAVAGHDLLWPRILNLLCGLTTAAVVARLAFRLWQSHLVAVIAALIAGTSVPLLYFEGQTEKTALTVLLITLGAWQFLIGSLRAIAAAGVIGGLAILARGNSILLVAAAAISLPFGWDREPAEAQTATRAQGARRCLVFVSGALAVVSLAIAHNWLAAGVFVPSTTNLGINLYLGNHSDNPYGYYDAPDFVRPDTGAELPDFRAEAERRTGRKLSDAELSRYWRDQAFEEIRSNPGLTVVRTLRKLRLLLHNDEVPDNEDVRMVAEWSPVLRLPFFWFGQLLVVGILGLVVAWPRRCARVLAATMAVYVASLLPFFVMARLRVQLMPFLAAFAAGAFVWLVAIVKARARRSLILATAVVVPISVVAFDRSDWMASRQTSALAIAWNNLGSTLVSASDNEGAIRAYERAIATDVRAVPASLRSLADLYRLRGDFLRAEAVLQQLLELKPSSRSARDSLGKLYDAMLADRRWRNDAVVRARAEHLRSSTPEDDRSNPARAAIARARSLSAQGQHGEAIRLLQEAVRRGPYDEGLHYFLGEMMEKRATPEAMIAFFSEEAARDEKPQTSHYFWAIGLARRGNVDDAIAHLEHALDIDPAHEMSQHQWGLLLERQGHLAEALEHFIEATKIHPDYRVALESAARVAAGLGRSAEAESYQRRASTANPNTDRRFFYWARYLFEHGRNQAAWVEIQRMLRERPMDPEALQLRDQIITALGGVAR